MNKNNIFQKSRTSQKPPLFYNSDGTPNYYLVRRRRLTYFVVQLKLAASRVHCFHGDLHGCYLLCPFRRSNAKEKEGAANSLLHEVKGALCQGPPRGSPEESTPLDSSRDICACVLHTFACASIFFFHVHVSRRPADNAPDTPFLLTRRACRSSY